MGTNRTLFEAYKQPSDKIVYTVDFSKLDIFKTAGVELTSVTATATDEDGSNCPSILGGCVVNAVTSKSVQVGILGGTDGQQYRCKLLAVTNLDLPDGSNYMTLEADIIVKVREI